MIEPAASRDVLSPPESAQPLAADIRHGRLEAYMAAQADSQLVSSPLPAVEFAIPEWLMEQLMSDPELDAGVLFIDEVRELYLFVPEPRLDVGSLDAPFLRELWQRGPDGNPCQELELDLGPAYIDGEPTGRTLRERLAPIDGNWRPLASFSAGGQLEELDVPASS